MAESGAYEGRTREDLIRELEEARRRITELEETGLDERKLSTVVEGAAERNKSLFFHAFTRGLAHALDVRYAFVSEFAGSRTRVRTISIWSRDTWLDNFEYDLKDTPCEEVLAGRFCFHPRNLQRLFPKDATLAELEAESYLGLPLRDTDDRVLGHIGVMDVLPMRGTARDRAIVDIFAARARSELERRRAELDLKETRTTLERSFEEQTVHLSRALASLNAQIKELRSAAAPPVGRPDAAGAPPQPT